MLKYNTNIQIDNWTNFYPNDVFFNVFNYEVIDGNIIFYIVDEYETSIDTILTDANIVYTKEEI